MNIWAKRAGQNLLVLLNSMLMILVIMMRWPVSVGPAFFIGAIMGACVVFCALNGLGKINTGE